MKKFIIVIIFSLLSRLHPANTKPVMHEYTALCKHSFISGTKGTHLIKFKAPNDSAKTCRAECKKKQGSLICLSVLPGHNFNSLKAYYKAAQDRLNQELEKLLTEQNIEDPTTFDTLEDLLKNIS